MGRYRKVKNKFFELAFAIISTTRLLLFGKQSKVLPIISNLLKLSIKLFCGIKTFSWFYLFKFAFANIYIL